jgi:hypothetical protein
MLQAQERERQKLLEAEEAEKLAKDLADKLALQEKALAEAEEAARILKEEEVCIIWRTPYIT